MTLEAAYDAPVTEPLQGQPDPRWMTRQAAAKLLGISERALDEHVKSPRNPTGRIRRWKAPVGGAVRLLRADVEAYKEERDAEPKLEGE